MMFNQPMNHTQFIMLIGPSASGKSTYALEITKDKENWIWLSSDKIRKELWGSEEIQDNPKEVFDIMQKRALEALFEGKSVVYDTTNLSLKNRRIILERLPVRVDKIAVVFVCDFKTLIENNASRTRKVPQKVIEKQIKQFEFPLDSEGFKEIHIRKFGSTMMAQQIMVSMENFAQDNSHHSMNLGSHCYATQRLLDIDSDDETKDVLRAATLLHDYGKLYTKTFINMKGEKTEDAHYYGHQNVGAYYSPLIFSAFINNEEERFKMIRLINYHMIPYACKTEKAINRWRERLGDELWEEILLLHEADKLAH